MVLKMTWLLSMPAAVNQSAKLFSSSGWLNSCGLLRQKVVGSGSRPHVPRPSRLSAGARASAADDGVEPGDGGFEVD
eukprot:3845102-Pyramimonas_sp.AAC.1